MKERAEARTTVCEFLTPLGRIYGDDWSHVLARTPHVGVLLALTLGFDVWHRFCWVDFSSKTDLHLLIHSVIL